MNREDIIRMAREAGIRLASQSDTVDPRNVYFHEIERYAHLVVAHEREVCVAIVLDNSDAEGICCTDDVLEAFRQRGET
jgi:Fe-S-cluster formation regulator IscX/YfhJ